MADCTAHWLTRAPLQLQLRQRQHRDQVRRQLHRQGIGGPPCHVALQQHH